MSEKLDVVGIGNAMVDAIIPSHQNEIEKHDINRDSMNLIDENLKNNALTSFIDLDRDLDTRCFGVYVMLEMVAIFSMVLKMFH